MKHFKFGILALALILLASCTTVSFQGMQMTKDVPSFNVVGEFEKTISQHAIIGGWSGGSLVKMSDNDERIFSIITDEVQKKGGDAAIDVTIEYGAGFVDLLLNAVTLSIYNPGKIKISGTIIKYTN
jgi:hypothetical protein